MNKLLYIGSGLHIETVLDFSEVKMFVFIDSRPRSEFGDCHDFDNILYRHTFYANLIEKCRKLGFELLESIILDKDFEKKYLSIKQRIYYGLIEKRPKHINPTLLVFFNKKSNQYVKYYISTNISLNKNQDLYNDLKTADILLISGHFPDIKLLEFIDVPKKLICYSGTSYNFTFEQDIEQVNIYPYFKQEKYFSNCYFVDKNKNYQITEYKNFDEMVKNNFPNYYFVNKYKIFSEMIKK